MTGAARHPELAKDLGDDGRTDRRSSQPHDAQISRFVS
jgi:hypothetical protein